jgi:hypothetical protein
MTAWKIAPAVGNVKSDDPGLITPIEDERQPRLLP